MAKNKSTGANLGFEQAHWQAADKLRGHMDAAEYKHVVPGLIFLKCISDAFSPYKGRVFAPCCGSGGMADRRMPRFCPAL